MGAVEKSASFMPQPGTNEQQQKLAGFR